MCARGSRILVGVNQMKNIGTHYIIELWDCNNLNSEEITKKALNDAVIASNATLLQLMVHGFAPQGVTGVAVIEESHISIHTWPELGYAAVDIFTCGTKVNPEAAIKVFKEAYDPQNVQCMQIVRGLVNQRTIDEEAAAADLQSIATTG